MAFRLMKHLSLLGVSLEATAGTAETMTAADVLFRCYDAKLDMRYDKRERVNAESAIGLMQAMRGPRSGSLGFTTYLHGKGSSGVPNAGILWQLAGMKLTTATYSTDSARSDWKTGTAALWEDGRRKALRGIMLNPRINLEAGAPAMVEWSGLGAYTEAPAAEANPSGTYESTTIPTWEGASSFTIDGVTTHTVDKLTIDLGYAPVLRQDPNKAGGYCWAELPGPRKATVQIPLDAVAFGTKNWWTDLDAGTEIDMTCVINGGTNNTITIVCNDMEPMSVEDQERDGGIVDALGFAVHGAITIAYS